MCEHACDALGLSCRISRITADGLWLSLAIGFTIALVVGVGCDRMVHAMGATPEVAAQVTSAALTLVLCHDVPAHFTHLCACRSQRQLPSGGICPPGLLPSGWRCSGPQRMHVCEDMLSYA